MNQWVERKKESKDERVAFLVDRVWVRYGEEACVDVERRVFFDGGGLAGSRMGKRMDWMVDRTYAWAA